MRGSRVASEGEPQPSARSRLRGVGIAVAALALTAFFMALRFPYDRLALRIAHEVEQRTGWQVALGDVGIGLVRWAPGIAVEPARIVQPDGTRLDLDRLGVRPALALAWLRGEPALAIDLASRQGRASGVLTWGQAGGFDGSLSDVDLELLPQERIGAPMRFQGHADAEIALTLGERGPEGQIVFEARDGLFSHPEMPLPMPFQKLAGQIDLGGSAWATIRDLRLESPLAAGHARGTIEHAPRFANAPLRIELELTVSGAIQSSLNAQGVAVGDSGKIRVAITGTPARPVVR